MAVKKQLELTRAAKRLFLSDDGKLKPDAELVLGELVSFCYCLRPTIQVNKDGATDVPKTFLAEGRREVALRFFQRLNINVDQLIRLERIMQERTGEDNG